MRLKNESQHLRVIASQLSSFVSSIAAVTERLAPKLGQSCQVGEQDQQMSSLMEEINALQPDSQQRVDALRGAEEERQTMIANRKNPLDDELIKTKDLLRPPSFRDKKGDRRRKEKDTQDKYDLLVTEEDGARRNMKPLGVSKSPDVEVSQHIKNDTNLSSMPASNTHANVQAKEDCEFREVDAYVALASDSAILEQSGAKSSIERKKICVAKTSIGATNSDNITCDSPKSRDERRGVYSDKRGDPSLRTSSEVDSEVIRNLLKDIENVKKRDSLSSSSRLLQTGEND